MSEQTNAEMTAAAARDILDQHDLGDVCDESTHEALTTVLDALEAAEQRAEEAEREYRVMVDQYEGQCDLTSELLDRYSGLAAVVEKVRGATRGWEVDQRVDPHQRAMNAVQHILAAAPADALREVKAAAWDEGYFRRMDDYPFDPEERDNPYRKEQP